MPGVGVGGRVDRLSPCFDQIAQPLVIVGVLHSPNGRITFD